MKRKAGREEEKATRKAHGQERRRLPPPSGETPTPCPAAPVEGNGRAPCGVPDCTCRKVLEYLPQSTLTVSARRCGASRKENTAQGADGIGRNCRHALFPGKNANRTAPCNGLHGAVRFATARHGLHPMQEGGSPNPTIRHPFAAGGLRKGTAAWHPARLRKSGGAGRFCLSGAPCGRHPTATLQTSCPPTGCRTHPTVPARGAPTGRPLS